MGAEKLGSYVLDHDEISFYIEDQNPKKIEYSSNEVKVGNKNKSEILNRDHHDYIDFKFSFDELNFKNDEEAVEKLTELAEDISKIKIHNPNKVSWNKQFRIDDNFDDLSSAAQEEKVRSLVRDKYKNDDEETPEVRNWERDKDGWGNEIVKVKLRRTYNREVTLNDSVISIHTKSRDEVQNKNNYKVKPHIHLVIDKNKAFGKNFSKLKQELYKEFKKHELTSSHNLEIERDRNSNDYKEYRVLKDRLTSFSWIVNKHEEGSYIKNQLNQYKRNNNCVKLDNVEDKLNRYLELGGSYDFARKLQINLKEKLDINIEIEKPKHYKAAEKNIENKNYRAIINDVREQVLNHGKISEKYKEYAKEVLQKDSPQMQELAAARAIKGVVKNRGYYLDHNWNKVIDKDRLNKICDKEIEKIESLELNKVKHKIDNKLYLDQTELRKDLKRAGIDDLEEISDLSEVAIVFQSHEKYIRENINEDELTPLTAYDDIKNQIDIMELDISEGWKKKIASNIYKDNYLDKAKTIIQNKITKAKAINGSYNAVKQGYNQLSKKIKNFTGAKNENIIFQEADNAKNQAKQSVRLITRLESTLEKLENMEFEKLDNSESERELREKLDKHEENINKHEELIEEFEEELETKSKEKSEEKSTTDKNKTDNKSKQYNILKEEIEKLEEEINEIQETKNKNYKIEDDLLGRNTLQYYENEIDNIKKEISNLEDQKQEIKDRNFFSKLFKNNEEELSEINGEIANLKNKLKDHEEVVNKVKDLRTSRKKLDKLLNNKQDDLKDKKLNLKKLLGLDKKKSKSKTKDKSR